MSWQKIVGEYSTSLVWNAHPEPEPTDLKADHISASVLVRRAGWTLEQLNDAISTFRHPQRIAFKESEYGRMENIYSWSAHVAWRERFAEQLRALGFKVK